MSINFCSSGGSGVFFDLRLVLAKLRDVLRLFPATAGLVSALLNICTVLALVYLQGFCFWPMWAVGTVSIYVVEWVGVALGMGAGWGCSGCLSQAF